MAVTALAETNDGGVNASSSTISINCTGAEKLIVGFCIRDVDAADRVPTSVTFNGTAMTAVTPANGAGVNASAGWYYLDSPAQTTADVVATYNAAVVSGLQAYALDDAATGAPSHAPTNTTTGANPSISVNAVASGFLAAILVHAEAGAAPFVTTGGGVQGLSVGVTRARSAGRRAAAGTGAESMDFTVVSGGYAIAAISIGPAIIALTAPVATLVLTGVVPTLALTGATWQGWGLHQ